MGRYKRINSQERRLIKAFPKLHSTRYNDALDKIRHSIFNKSENRSVDDSEETKTKHNENIRH